MAVEIQLIDEIEKHEFLYNFNLAEYNRKDLVEEAWTEIADTINLTVTECKEKWRNIRSSFLRSIKGGNKTKKPYYLTEYLQFVIPYLKPGNSIETTEEYDSPHTNETEMVDFIKQEPVDVDCAEHPDDINPMDMLNGDVLTRRPVMMRKKRRLVRARKIHGTPMRIRRTPISNTERTSNNFNYLNSNQRAMKIFLLSLLPELETMTDDQLRLFKIKSMILIDELKVNYSAVRQSTASINNERLQKRLINLLLKNLRNKLPKTSVKQQSTAQPSYVDPSSYSIQIPML